MTKTFRHPNKRDLFIVGTAAALAFAPRAMAAEGSSGTTEVEALRDENAHLRDQLAETQKKLEQLKKGAGKPAKTAAQQKAAKDPYALKELDSGYENAAGAAPVQGAPSKTATEMTCGANMMFKMPPGSQFYYNPVFGGTDVMYHTHPEGMWMFNAKEMHSQLDGLQAGNYSVPLSQVGPAYFPASIFGASSPYPSKYPYMMIPTHMSMDMVMFMGMYGVTDRLTLMVMANYQTMTMRMKMDMGNMPVMPDMNAGGEGEVSMPAATVYHNVFSAPPMATGGLGDTEVDAIYKIYDDRTLGNLTGALGLSIPTGSIRENIQMMGINYRAPYDMQLGSGTFNFKPALTYNWLSSDALWNLGAQASGILHMGTNNGWAYGDSVKISGWAQRAIGDATTWFRMTYTDTAQIRGHDPLISCLNSPCDGTNPYDWAPTPDADPHNYGGQILNAFIGASYQYHGFSFGLEGGVPIYQNLNGLQLKNHWQSTLAFQAMF